MKTALYLITALTALTLFSSCNSRQVVLTDDEVVDDVFYLKNEIKPYTGLCLVYYTDSEIVMEEMNYMDGILHGVRKSFYKNGQIKREGFYENGSLHGMWKGWDEEGNKLYEVNYDNDSLIGEFITWYSTGVIKEHGQYQHNLRVGDWKTYDEAGMFLKKSL